MDCDSAILTLNIAKSGIVTASDIICPSNVSISNTELEICTSTGTRSVTIEIGVEKGIGVRMADAKKYTLDTVYVDQLIIN